MCLISGGGDLPKRPIQLCLSAAISRSVTRNTFEMEMDVDMENASASANLIAIARPNSANQISLELWPNCLPN